MKSYILLPGFLLVLSTSIQLRANCDRGENFDSTEMAKSSFYSNRELTKFSNRSNSFPLPKANRARYCASRGCSQQLDVTWTGQELQALSDLRNKMGADQSDSAELRFVRVATLQMEKWLRDRIVRDGTKNTSHQVTGGDGTEWISKSLNSYSPLNKECVTYTMEASQHLMILANSGLVRRWNVKPPTYVFGIPGHWTATIQNRKTCQNYRFDLNTSASARENLMASGENPAAKALRDSRLLPGMDNLGLGSHKGSFRANTEVLPIRKSSNDFEVRSVKRPQSVTKVPAVRPATGFDSRRFWEEQERGMR